MCASFIKDMLKEENLDSAYCLEALDRFLKAGRISRDQLEKLLTFIFRIIETAVGKNNDPNLHIVLPVMSSPRADHTTPKPETSDAGPV